jgi:hypothetical protein
MKEGFCAVAPRSIDCPQYALRRLPRLWNDEVEQVIVATYPNETSLLRCSGYRFDPARQPHPHRTDSSQSVRHCRRAEDHAPKLRSARRKKATTGRIPRHQISGSPVAENATPALLVLPNRAKLGTYK